MTAVNPEFEQLVAAVTEELNAGNLDAIAGFLVDDYDDREGNDSTVSELVEIERTYQEPFDDYHEELVHLTANETTVMAQYDVTGTHEREFWNVPPTGETFEVPLIRLFEVEDGRIATWRSLAPALGMLTDLGLDWDALKADLPAYVSDSADGVATE